MWNRIFGPWIKARAAEIEAFKRDGPQVQLRTLFSLLRSARDTEFGREHSYGSIRTLREFQQAVPVRSYEQFYPYIERVMEGIQGVVWPTPVLHFCKSSGTSNDRSKYIPMSKEALVDCHRRGGKDLIVLYHCNYPDSRMISGKCLILGGGLPVLRKREGKSLFISDLSSVLAKNFPFWVRMKTTPSRKTLLMEDWEAKVRVVAKECRNQRITSILGIPSWISVLFQHMMEVENLESMEQVWPDAEVYFHGGISMDPYREPFGKFFPSHRMRYMESYNASEGYFGIQDQPDSQDMLLMLDYGIFYEFLPHVPGVDSTRAIPLGEVEVGKVYSLVITTNAGLWRYQIGDTIRFTSLSPYRFRVVGRVQQFINAFGEELMIENAEAAMVAACESTKALLADYTASPYFMGQQGCGGHEWAIAFRKPPPDLKRFGEILDAFLRKLNSDYDTKRANNMVMQPPRISVLAEATFYEWMKSRKKLGGQHKIPRLRNDRSVMDSILSFHDSKIRSERNH